MSSVTSNPNRVDAQAVFATTRWSVVLAAAQSSSPQSDRALAHVCKTYWYPLYAFARRQGRSAEDAEDLTQAFFAKILEKKIFRGVDPEKGRFRSFLLASLKNFMANERARSQAEKRGGTHCVISLDAEEAENRFSSEPCHEATPEKIFDRTWATTTVENALMQLKQEYSAGGKAELFDQLQFYLSGDRDEPAYAALAAHLTTTEAAIKMAVVRLRRRFGQVLRAHVGQTVASDAELDEEIRYLFTALAS